MQKKGSQRCDRSEDKGDGGEHCRGAVALIFSTVAVLKFNSLGAGTLVAGLITTIGGTLTDYTPVTMNVSCVFAAIFEWDS